MIEANLIFFLLFLLIILQSIAGVGILVVGTPMLLFFEFNIVQILSTLLPISILTSLINLIFLKIYKLNTNIKIDKEIKLIFFSVCLPFIFLGLYFLENFKDYINFKYLISAVIFISLIINNQKKYFFKLNKKNKIFYLSLIGIIHGISNTGGSLLSLFLSSHLNKNQSRYNITYFYFFLALFQFLMFSYVFNLEPGITNFKKLLIIIPIGVLLGNFIAKYTNETFFRRLISTLSVLTCVVLLSNH